MNQMSVGKPSAQSFLDTLSEESRNSILEHGTTRKVIAGEILFEEGSQLHEVYIIVRGQVKLSKQTAEGKTFTLFLKQNGDLISEGMLFDDTASSMTAEAVTASEISVLSIQEMRNLFLQDQQLAIALMSWCSIQTQSTQAKFRDLILSGKQGALYSTLIRFAHSYGQETERGILIKTPLTHQDLADYAGSTRENVNRMIMDLKQNGILTMEKSRILIHDLEYMKDILHCGSCPIDICTM
ncbi:Crp/Fnr family transcriptional regulator [Salisediminibacterium selenitireducens]|uniref:Transcriptional regulator, Crp/Fnr family n=1 Tax=Bacillus selenitireducens (strain ATCC 700615 / DSM 15326 / MLS10) TaxID=439292 RepID=D6XTA6_BACIE|nr:Crp/Fnr family transcriptional regulator [Salisediminibacterium selenitireducens]ADH99042.1 transcriptional regulator, Crp/Fnr family [[Bacillus] selenitireducens MLS10]